MNTATRLLVNLSVVTVSFLLNMSTYMCLEAVQSSLNAGKGTASLSVAYSTVVFTSLFLPTLTMDFLRTKNAIGAATMGYAAYTIANCYPTTYTLIFAAVILGCGGSVLWTAGRVYISELAVAYAVEKDVDKGKTTSVFFGIFMAAISGSLLIGNNVLSVVMRAITESVRDENTEISQNLTSNVTIPSKNGYCGIHSCDKPPELVSSNESSPTQNPQNYNKTVVYILFAIFAASQIFAALLAFFVLTDPPREKCEGEVRHENVDEILMTEVNEDNSNENHSKKVHERKPLWQRIKTQLFATTAFMFSNHHAQALAPITLHTGLVQALAFGHFTTYWISCYMGIAYIGFYISVYGIGSILGSLGAGFFPVFAPRWAILLLNIAVEMGLGISLLLWEPNVATDEWVFWMIPCLLGIVYSVYKTILSSVFSTIFPEKGEAANATFTSWDMLGTAVAYALTGTLCTRLFTFVMLSLASIGMILYTLAERNYSKVQRKSSTKT